MRKVKKKKKQNCTEEDKGKKTKPCFVVQEPDPSITGAG